MFKKSLLAAAIMGAAFNASAALTVDTTIGTTPAAEYDAGDSVFLISEEGLPATRVYTMASAANANVEITFDAATAAAVADGSIIKLEIISGATFSANPAVAPTLNEGGAVDDAVSYNATVGTNALYIDFDDGANNTVELAANDTLTLEDIPMIINAGASEVQVRATVLTAASNPGVSEAAVPGTASTATSIASVVTQWTTRIDNDPTSTAGRLNGSIDVGNARLILLNGEDVGGNAAFDTDRLILESVTAGAGATAQSVTVTIKSDFITNFPEDGNGRVMDNANNVYQINDDGDAASFTYTTTTTPTAAQFLADDEFEIEVKVDSTDGIPNAVIGEREFTYSAALVYQDAGTITRNRTLASDVYAGAWTLNGDDAFISFMPFSSAFSQSITVTNDGTVDGEITVDWYYNGTVTTTELTTVAAGRSVTDISAELRAIAAANGITGNAALDIVVNSPDGDIRVDALYFSKSDRDRGVVAVEQ